MDLKKKRESFERKRGRENEFNARQNLSSSLLTVFSTAVTFSPIKCGYSFTGSLLASLRAKREFTMHVKYSSVTLLCIPFPFVSLRYFAYIYTHTRTFTLLLLHSFLATGLPLSSVLIHSLTIFFKSLAFTRIRIFKIS